MTENLLNIGSSIHKSQKSEQTSPLKKAYMDSSCNFDKVFDSANKTYNNYNVEKKLTSVSTPPKYAERLVEKENFNKVEEKKHFDDSSKVKEKDEFLTHKDEVSKKPEEAKETDEPNDSVKDDDSEGKDSSDEHSQDEDDSQPSGQEKAPILAVAEAAVDQAVSLLTKTVSAAEQSPAATDATEKVVGLTEQAVKPTEQTVKTNKSDEKLDVDLSKVTQNPKDIIDSKNLKAKVQSEVQQVLLNLNVEPGAKSAQANSAAPADIADAKTQSPLIQASADVVAKAVGGPSAKKVLISEMLEKAALNQDILDKTNAQVVSVETSSSSGNLLNQQNAKEHGVKMSLEVGNSSTVSNVSSSNAQVNFDKKIEVAQAPKELSKTDILSQIHTKLDGLKEEGVTKITIVLKPENLGKINLELINSKDGFTARMTTENAQVKELLDKNLDSLKTSLASQGVNVGNVTVKVAEVENQSNEMFSFDQRQPQSGEQQSSAGSNGSNNSSNQNNSYGNRNAQGYFEEEIVNNAATTVSGESDSRIVHDGQIDYKI